MRFKNYLWLLPLLWQACLSPQDLEFDDATVEVSERTEIGMPLFSGSLSLEDLMGIEQSKYLSLQPDDTYQMTYQQQDTLANFALITGRLKSSGLNIAQPQIKVTLPPLLQQQALRLPISFDTPEASYQMLRFKQGILQVKIIVGETGGSVSVELEGANVPVQTQQISDNGEAVFNLDLKGKELSSQPVYLAISGTVPYKVEQLSLQTAELSAMRFTLTDPKTVQIPIRDQQVSLEFFQREQLIENISIKNPDLRFQLVNQELQAQMQLNFTDAKAFSKKGDVPISLKETPSSNNEKTYYVESGLREVIEQQPTYMRISGNLLLQLPASTPVYLGPETLVLSNLKLQLPLEVQLSGLNFEHVSDKQTSDYDLEAIEEAALDISFKNGLPLGAALSLRTLKEGKVTAEIPLRNQQQGELLPHPQLNEQGDVISSSTTQVSRISLGPIELKKLLEADQIVFTGAFSTPKQQYSRLRKGMTLGVQTGLYLRAKIKSSSNN